MLKASCSTLAIFIAGALLATQPSHAESDKMVLPAGAVTWQYECKSNDCPTRCEANAAELFSTGTFAALSITQLPGRGYWLRVSTAAMTLDYHIQADRVMCTVTGATLTSVRTEPAGPGAPPVRP